MSIRSGGGGGWGPAHGRDPELVARDVYDGLLGVDEAAAIYGVVLEQAGGAWRVDRLATERRRAAHRLQHADLYL